MSVVLAMCLFAFSMSVSPGPVNLITLSTGVNYGFRQALPFVSGAVLGFTLLLLLVGLGIARLAEQVPLFQQLLGIGGTGFIAWMGLRIAMASAELRTDAQRRPSFTQGVLLQWLNPKAWIACLSGVSAFNLTGSHSQLLLFCGLYFLICYLSVSCWAFAGERISVLISDPGTLQWLNRIMGAVLVLVAGYLLYLQLNG